jgi:hypothetical protein
MKYLVFDLDQTLADVSLVYYFLLSLTIKDHITECRQYMLSYFPDDLDNQLKEAYQLFVERIAEAEASEQPLGILRPGILKIMKQIHTMKDDITHVAIYSNNQYLPSIEFVRNIIHRVHRASIIGTCIHWNHPKRRVDHESQPFVTKTWDALRSIIADYDPSCHFIPKHVYFFDDQNHIHLQMTLGENYYKVPIYKTHDSTDRIAEIFTSCLIDAKVNPFNLSVHLTDVLDPDMMVYPSTTEVKDLVDQILRAARRGYQPSMESHPIDHGILMMKNVLDEIHKENRNARFMRGGKRRTIRSRRYTLKKLEPSSR